MKSARKRCGENTRVTEVGIKISMNTKVIQLIRLVYVKVFAINLLSISKNFIPDETYHVTKRTLLSPKRHLNLMNVYRCVTIRHAW